MVAAGHGDRFGGLKQVAPLGGRRVLDWSLDAARAVSSLVVVVAPLASSGDQAVSAPGADVVVPGGDSRAGSVRAGLGALPDDVDVVVVHDAARPLASVSLFRSVIGAVIAGAAGAIPGVAVEDTLKRVEGGLVTATVDRRSLVRVQTPQAFRACVLRAAHGTGLDATDDAGLVEQSGHRVVVVEGEPTNLKLTTAKDLDILEALRGCGAAPVARRL